MPARGSEALSSDRRQQCRWAARDGAPPASPLCPAQLYDYRHGRGFYGVQKVAEQLAALGDVFLISSVAHLEPEDPGKPWSEPGKAPPAPQAPAGRGGPALPCCAAAPRKRLEVCGAGAARPAAWLPPQQPSIPASPRGAGGTWALDPKKFKALPVSAAATAFQHEAARGVQVVHSARKELTDTEVATFVLKGLAMAEVQRA